MRFAIRSGFVGAALVVVAATSLAGTQSGTPAKPADPAPKTTPPAPSTPAPSAPASPPAAPPADQAPVFVLFSTDRGDMVLELDPAHAPITVKNFLDYVDAGYYNGTVFHRIVPQFVIQGGGFDASLTAKKPRGTIKNECANGLKNLRGSISMARLPTGLDTASSQFFINLKDNPPLDTTGNCYAVFGKIVRGMDVVDKIANIRTGTRTATNESGAPQLMPNVPLETVAISKARKLTAAEVSALPAEKPATPPATTPPATKPANPPASPPANPPANPPR